MVWVMASLGSFLILIPGWHFLSLVEEGRSLVLLFSLCHVDGSVAGFGASVVTAFLHCCTLSVPNSDHLIFPYLSNVPCSLLIFSNMQCWSIVSIQRISIEPLLLFNVPPHLSFIFLPKPIAHIPALSGRIRTQHLERPRLVLQETMGNPGWNDNQIPFLNHRLDASRVLLAAKTQPRTPGDDSEDFMRGGMEVRLPVHGILPLGDHYADVLEAR